MESLLEQIQQVLSYFSTYSPPKLRHLSYRGTNFCILCRRSLPPGIRTTVWHSSPPVSFSKRWSDRNFLRCKKIWKSLGCEVRGIGWMIKHFLAELLQAMCLISSWVWPSVIVKQDSTSTKHPAPLVHQKLYHRQHFTVGGSWNKSLHLQPLQQCYCENLGSPASACIITLSHICSRFTQ